MVNFTCDQCGRKYIYRHGLDRHARRNHAAHPFFSCDQCERLFTRSNNLEKHKRTYTGGQVAVPVAAPAAKKRYTGVAPEFQLLGGVVEEFTVNMKEAKHLSPLKKAITVFKPVMTTVHQEHHVCKFQIVVSVVFHNAVDTAVITQPPVALASEMVAVYADAVPPFNDVNRQPLNFIEVYEHNRSGWAFSNFASLQLTLWYLDPTSCKCIRVTTSLNPSKESCCKCHWDWR